MLVKTEAMELTPPDAPEEGPEEGGEPRSYAVLRVADTGPGIQPEILDRVFEPFFSTKDIGPGVGLGLYTAYGIVGQCGGHLTVDSSPGRGATFSAYFPLLPAPVP